MRILKIAERADKADNSGRFNEAEPLPEKNWLAPGSTASKYIKNLDDLRVRIVQCKADKEKEMASVFVNGVELIYGSRTDCEHVKELIERLMRERIIYREKALAGEWE